MGHRRQLKYGNTNIKRHQVNYLALTYETLKSSRRTHRRLCRTWLSELVKLGLTHVDQQGICPAAQWLSQPLVLTG